MGLVKDEMKDERFRSLEGLLGGGGGGERREREREKAEWKKT